MKKYPDEYDEDDPLEEFLCPTCGLHLSGTRELDVTDLPEQFYQTEEREREFEPEYGND